MNTEVWSLNWNDELRVGIPEIDHEHEQFVTLVNELNRAIVDRMELDKIRTCLQSILDNARTDAVLEAEILQRKNYPHASDHAQSHQAMDMRIQEILGGLDDSSTLYEWIDASLKVKKILVRHFLSEDMKIRDYCSPGSSQQSPRP